MIIFHNVEDQNKSWENVLFSKKIVIFNTVYITGCVDGQVK